MADPVTDPGIVQQMGVINGRTLTKHWRYATVIIAVIAAAMPGADPVTTALETLPLTAKAWAQGEISASAARAICEGRPEGHEDAYGEVEETLVGFAADRNWRALRAVIAHCKRCADALDDREPADRNGLHLSKTMDRWAIVRSDASRSCENSADHQPNGSFNFPSSWR